MKRLTRVSVGVVGAVALLAAVIALRTITYRAAGDAGTPPLELAAPVPIDLDLAAQHLAEAVRIRTVSEQDPTQNDWSEWERLRAWLLSTYPAAHAATTLWLEELRPAVDVRLRRRPAVGVSFLNGREPSMFKPRAAICHTDHTARSNEIESDSGSGPPQARPH